MRKFLRVAALVCVAFWLGTVWGTLPKPWETERETTDLIPVYDADANALVWWSLEAYVAGVVAAEMPASYQLEALKAQAVAARTRALSGFCVQHPEAKVCTDPLCCQAYLGAEDRLALWGAEEPVYEEKVRRAAQETAGEILEYDGEPILVLYHAVSGGRTEDVELVYGQSLPYLRGVESAGEEHASRFETVQIFSRERFAQAVNDAYPKAKLEASKLEDQVSVEARSASGRVIGMRVGGAYIDGRDLRKALGLNSTQFELTFEDDQVIASQRGYGHGVGMSQAGAEAMARTGASYADILHHYYTGVQIVHIVPEDGSE